VVATSSLRRKAQLLNLRPDLSVVDVRGNVDTRIAKLDQQPAWAAIVLATAGLVRLGLEHRIGERVPPELMLPAPGQGALAVTVRTDEAAIETVTRQAMHDPATALEVRAERGFLRRLEGGCQVPIGAYAVREASGTEPTLRLRGRVISLAGDKKVEGEAHGSPRTEAEADALGAGLAERLLKEGAAEILVEVRSAAAPAVAEP
jgi:hydroxymethylbilane synthase